MRPQPGHGGRYCRSHNRLDEARSIVLGGGKVLMLARTPEGHLKDRSEIWVATSTDEGGTWKERLRARGEW